MSDARPRRPVVAGVPAAYREGGGWGRAAGPAAAQLLGSGAVLAELHEDPLEEPYRPELVARLERAVREGRYRPDSHAIADALVKKLDELGY